MNIEIRNCKESKFHESSSVMQHSNGVILFFQNLFQFQKAMWKRTRTIEFNGTILVSTKPSFFKPVYRTLAGSTNLSQPKACNRQKLHNFNCCCFFLFNFTFRCFSNYGWKFKSHRRCLLFQWQIAIFHQLHKENLLTGIFIKIMYKFFRNFSTILIPARDPLKYKPAPDQVKRCHQLTFLLFNSTTLFMCADSICFVLWCSQVSELNLGQETNFFIHFIFEFNERNKALTLWKITQQTWRQTTCISRNCACL